MKKTGILKAKFEKEDVREFSEEELDEGKLDEGFEKSKREYFQSAVDAGVQPSVVLDQEDRYEIISILGEKLTITKEIIEGDEDNG